MKMRRREFITLLGGAAATWPLAARAQQPAIAVIGYLDLGSPEMRPSMVAAFRKGLSETGYIEGGNLSIEYRFAHDQFDRLAELAGDLVRRRVAVIVARPGPAALAAKAATSTIPIVFEIGSDPVQAGLVASLDRPGGNITGAASLNVELGPKRLELLHELLPAATLVGMLLDPVNPGVEEQSRDMQAAARALGVDLHILRTSSEGDIMMAFATLAELRAGALVIGGGAFLLGRIELLTALTLRHGVPSISQDRDLTAAGGLMSYGGNLAESYRLAGVYTGRILKGEKPADLPVQQSTKTELIINLKTAKSLGLNVPPSLLARADEVIE
jgi:putative tryptophan/tyrosine transport system substrate-binding protein